MGKQIERLKNHAHLLTQSAHGLRVVVNQGLAIDLQRTLLKGFQAIDAPEQRAFARPTFADDGNDFARAHVQVNALEHLVVAKRLAQALDVDRGLGFSGCGHGIDLPVCGRTG